MRKILNTVLFVIIMLLQTGYAKLSCAFLPQLAIDAYYMPDIPDNIVSLSKSLGGLGVAAQKTVNATENTINNAKVAANAAFSGELTSLNDVGGINPGQKPIVDCHYQGQKFEMTKADHVSEITRLLFLQYPSDPRIDIIGAQKYDKYRRDFYRDSLMEIYTASLAMQKELENVVKPQVQETMKCITGDSTNCGIPAPDGNNDAAFVEGKGLEALANVYQMLLKVTALKAQLVSIKYINIAKPDKFVSGVKEEAVVGGGSNAETSASSQQQSSLNTNKNILCAQAHVQTSSTVAFAQIGISKVSKATSLSDIEANTKLKKISAQEYVGKTLGFVMVPEDRSTHPYTEAASKLEELNKITPVSTQIDTATEVHNLSARLSDYKNTGESLNEMRESYARALKALMISNKCALDYISRRYSNPHVAWAGDDLGKNINNADIRKGISGWTLEAYEVAKAAQAAVDATATTPAADVDFEDVGQVKIGEEDKAKKLMKDSGIDSISSNKEEQSVKQSRETNMIPWQIGSEAAYLLSDTPEKWGNVIRKDPIWTDIKTFYNQYLQFKYENIRSYLKSYSKNDVLAVVTERLKDNQVAINDNLKQVAIKDAMERLNLDMANIAQEEKVALMTEDQQHKGAMNDLKSRRQSILSKMSTVEAKQKELSDKLSDLRNKAQDDAINTMQKSVTHQTPFPTEGYAVTNEMPIQSSMVATADDDAQNFSALTAENKENSEIKDVKADLIKEKIKISNLEKELANLNKEVIAQKMAAPGKVASIIAQLKAQKINKSDTIMDEISNLDIEYSNNVKAALLDVIDEKNLSTIQTPALMIYGSISSAAGAALDDIYNKVDLRINLAQQQLSDLGDDLYLPQNHDRVVAIHQSMMNDIKAMALTIAALGVGTIDDIMIFANIADADISPEEEDFFVGATAKLRDLKAPKVVFEEKLPPLREAVYFDDVDWRNVTSYIEGDSQSKPIMKEDFLSYGGRIPEIWKQLLKENAFVERSIDLKSALNQGCESVALYRGGLLPCKVKNSSLSIDVDEDARYIKSVIPATTICSGIEMKDGKPHHLTRDVEITFPNAIFSSTTQEPANCRYSELGTLFDADTQGNIFFRKSANDAFYNIVYEQKHAEDEKNNKEKRLMAIYDQTPLNRNVQSDFLNYFEAEQNLRKNLEEAEQEYKEMVDELHNMLKNYGFSPTKEFDISKPSDYELARKKLKNIKNKSISEASKKSEKIKIKDDAVAQERMDTIRSMVAALKKDGNETVIVSAGVEEDNKLDEEIKSTKVNEDVVGKYNKSMKEASEKAKFLQIPYCPNY